MAVGILEIMRKTEEMRPGDKIQISSGYAFEMQEDRTLKIVSIIPDLIERLRKK